MVAWARRNPGLALLALALASAIALYAATLGYELVNYDDPWLVRDNWILRHPSWRSLHAVFLDTSGDTRFALGAEYLPVRDLSIMLDGGLWGTWYGGFHLTNLVLYLGAIAIWYRALEAFGIDATLAGIAVLLWAVHPSHAESVAWISERKGLLACLFAGIATLGYARFRGGRSAAWLAGAALAAVCAVWSKAPAAFAIAAIAGLEIVLPGRASWRRSVVGLAVLASASVAAFAPVLLVATQTAVVGAGDHAPAGYAAMGLGLHGFYLELAGLAIPSAVSYPIGTLGPSQVQIVLGAIGLATALALAVLPARGRFRPPPVLRAAAILWLAGWLPVSRLVLPLRAVLVADRYMLLATLGIALAAAAALSRIARPSIRIALLAALVIASGLRTLDAQASWRDATSLWGRAVASNPDDGNAWSMYAEALGEAGAPAAAADAVAAGLAHTRAPRLVMRQALLALAQGHRPEGVQLMREAAQTEPRAMSNLALLLLDDGRRDEALGFAERGAAALPRYAPASRALGKVALAAGRAEQARGAFSRAAALEPANPTNRYDLALALIALHRGDEARAALESCVGDPVIGDRARAALAELR